MKLSKVEVGGHTYELGEWPVDKAIEIMTWLSQTIGPVLFQAVSGAQSLSSVMDADLGQVLNQGVVNALTNIKSAEVKERFRQIAGVDLLCDGKQIDYNTHYQGRIGHLLKVSVAVIKFQYADFLDVLPSAATRGAGGGISPSGTQASL